MTNSEEKVYDPSSGLWTKPKDNQSDSSTVTGLNSNQNPTLNASELSALEEMPRDALRKLLERICGARWGEVALMTKDERLEAARLKLWHAGLTQQDIFKALPPLREVMDREAGKPAQSIAMKVEVDSISKLSDEKILRLERELSRVTGNDAIVIAPLPGKLED